MTTQPDIYTVEARRRLAEACKANASPISARVFLDGVEDHLAPVKTLAATLRELNWQPPVDPDLVEAREMAAQRRRRAGYADFTNEILSGEWDEDSTIQLTLAAIKRGRELERGA